MKIYIMEDEAYPVYFVSNKDRWGGIEIEVSDEWYTEYQKINKRFWEMNTELKKLYAAS